MRIGDGAPESAAGGVRLDGARAATRYLDHVDVLSFPYSGYQINLLDTPGHQDFSEDTYRTLTAVDSAVMVLDAARGIEPQTLKLFEVCRMQHTPIFTFINKLDRPAKHPLELLDEIERNPGHEDVPLNWPIGDGPDFRGVFTTALTRTVHLFERTEHGAKRAPADLASLDDPRGGIRSERGRDAALREEVDLVTAPVTNSISPPCCEVICRRSASAARSRILGWSSSLTRSSEYAPPPGFTSTIRH